jgi:hypothetical protein
LVWACEWLADKGRDDSVKTFLRAVDSVTRGGKLNPAPEGFWNVETVTQVRFSEAMVGERRSPDAEYIFFELESFTNALRDIRMYDVPAELGHLHFSPFMQLMLRAIEEYSITPDNQPKSLELQAWFKQEWRSTRTLGDRLFKAMATFVREVERMDGAGFK